MQKARNIVKYKGFTLVELLVVISIIGFIMAVMTYAFNNARYKARDTSRIASLKQIQTAINLYYDTNLTWPARTADSCCDGWDQGYCNSNKSDGFIAGLVDGRFMTEVPGDPKFYGGCDGFSYYVYNAGSYGCDASKGRYYVLGIRNLETDSRPPTKYSGSGWSCPSRNWQNEFDYVVGAFESN